MKILIYIATGLGIFAFFRISNKFVQMPAKKQKSFRMFLRVLPLTEFIAWTIFVLWVLKGFLSEWKGYLIITIALIFLLIIMVGWYFLRDFIAGIILKAENAFNIDQQINTPDVAGKIRNVGSRALEIECESGQFSKIPYSRLSAQIFGLQPPAETMLNHDLILELPSSLQIENIREQIVRELLLLPWISVNHTPAIKIMQENTKTVLLKISYHTTNDSQVYAINQHLRKTFSGKD